MEADRVWALRDALSHTDWWERASTLGQTIRRTSGPGHLLLVGTPKVEPWHLAAHLDDEARLTGLTQLAPQLVRWHPPANAPGHLTIGMDRLETVSRGETVFVISPDVTPDSLLERVDDARRVGATIVALDGAEGPLAGLAHERMTVTASGLAVPEGLPSAFDERHDQDGSDGQNQVPADVMAGLSLPASFELAQHFVSAAAGSSEAPQRGWRDRLAHLLETISGPQPNQRPASKWPGETRSQA